MVRFSVQDSGAVAVLTLPVNLTRNHADTLKTYLRRTLDCGGRLIVDCGNVASADENCLAILCTAFRLSKQLGRDFVLAGQRPAAVLDAAREGKGLHCVECSLENEHGCIWGGQ